MIEIKKSKINGKGVFSTEDVRRGKMLGVVKHIPAERRSKFTLDLDDGSFVRFIDEFRYLNHSNKPNVFISDRYVVRALRNIKKGDELTMFYGEEFSEYLKNR